MGLRSIGVTPYQISSEYVLKPDIHSFSFENNGCNTMIHSLYNIPTAPVDKNDFYKISNVSLSISQGGKSETSLTYTPNIDLNIKMTRNLVRRLSYRVENYKKEVENYPWFKKYPLKAVIGLGYELPKLAVYDIPNAFIRENLGIPDEVSTKEGLKYIGKGVYYLVKEAPHNLKDPSWWKRNYHVAIPIILPIVFTVAAGIHTYLTKTSYHLRLNSLASAKLGDLPPIKELWEQGKMPIQEGFGEVVNLANASINLHKNPVDPGSTIFRVSTRELTESEKTLIDEWKSGAFTGLDDYLKIAAADAVYATGTLLVRKHEKAKHE